MAKDITLVLPGLRRFEDEVYRELLAPAERLPALELIIARSRNNNFAARNLDQTLWRLFGMPPIADAGLPAAALAHSLRYETSPDYWYMHCDPVVIQPNRDHLLMLGNSMLEFSEQEALQIISDINGTYDDQPWRLKLLTANQWIMEMPRAPAIKTHALSRVTGEKIYEFLPTGGEAKTWHALMNELQMLLHSHPVNQARAASGLPAANSIWFWGEGRLPVAAARPNAWAQCWSQHTSTLALAKLNKIPHCDLPATANDWLKLAMPPGSHLVVMDFLDAPALFMDPALWWQALSRLNAQWLAPLLAALQNKTLTKITLHTADGGIFELTPARAKRWWKRIKALI